MEDLIITKASGKEVVFSFEKLRQSLRNSGANEIQINQVVEDITPRLQQGISTKKIYKWAFALLKKTSKHVAAKYQLKTAIMELGPSGFPFEKYIAELYKRQGYGVKVGTIVQGTCVTHEVDVLATTEKEHLLVECKFHSLQGKQSDVKVSLYFHSRFRDVHSQWILRPEISSKKIEGWVVTNTRFSPDALQYANCSGIKLLSWDFPQGNGLKDLVERYFLYPITCLTSITKLEKEKLLLENIVFCEDILVKQDRLRKVGVIDRRINLVLDEVRKMKDSSK